MIEHLRVDPHGARAGYKLGFTATAREPFQYQRIALRGHEPDADGIQAELRKVPPTIDSGNELLSLAADQSADYLVMGGYGHSRLREFILGGTTRTILETMTLPVFLSH